MFKYEVAAAIAPLKAEAVAKLREDSKAARGKTTEVLRYAADHLFDADFSTGRELLEQLGCSRQMLTTAGRVLAEALGVEAMPVRDYVYDLRIDVVRRFVAAYPDAPLWMVIAEVGLPRPETFDYHNSVRGGTHATFRGRPLRVDFDYVTFDRDRRDRLAPEDRGRLVEYLHRLNPAAGTPGPQPDPPAEPALPEHRLGCAVELVPRGPERAILLTALADCFYRIVADRSRLWSALQFILDDFCEYLFTDPAVDYSGKARLRTTNRDHRAELGFLLDEYLFDYQRRHQVQVATPLLVETRLPLGTIAKVVGLSEGKLVEVYEARTGESPEAVRGGPEPREPYDLWRRAPRGTLDPSEVARLTAVLQQPPKPQPTRILLPGRRRPVEVDVDPRFLIPPGEWEALRSVAVQLTWENRFESRPEIERTLSVSEFAPSLYRMRQVQCVETAYRQLLAGQKPEVDPYASWLKHRRKADGQKESPMEVWEGVVGGLVDAPAAFAELGGLEEKRCRLLAMPEAKRKAAIKDASQGFQDFRLAWWCLIAEEAFHRSYGNVVAAQGQVSVWIAEALREEMHCGIPRALFGVASARLGNGYKIEGLIDSAHKSLAPALATIKEFQLGPYAKGDILWLHGAVLLNDQGSPHVEALKRYEEARAVLATFDQHLAAKATVMMAEAQRHDPGSGYLETLARGIAGLDGLREPVAKAMAEYNLLFYLASERRIQEARWYQAIFRLPTHKHLRAGRLAIDGCVEIVADNLELAEALLLRALEIFAELGRQHDLVSIYLYLAYVKYESHELVGCRSHLESALVIARGLGLAQAPAIAALVCRVNSEQRAADLILAEALKAGGCLGPKAEAI